MNIFKKLFKKKVNKKLEILRLLQEFQFKANNEVSINSTPTYLSIFDYDGEGYNHVLIRTNDNTVVRVTTLNNNLDELVKKIEKVIND